MSLLSSFSDFFELLFYGSNPETLKKRELRKLETELRTMTPSILKNRMLLPEFSNAFHVLNQQCAKIKPILSSTIQDTENNLAANYIELLISTGFTEEDCINIKSFQYETRKAIIKEAESEKKALDKQRSLLEKTIKSISSSEQMQQIEVIIERLMQLYDICCYDYEKLLRSFDSGYLSDPKYTPQFISSTVFNQHQKLLDFYFVSADFSVTQSLAKALCVLQSQHKHRELMQAEITEIENALKKMASILNKIISPEIIFKLIAICQQDVNIKLDKGNYDKNYIEGYCEHLRQTFITDTQRMQNELKDERLSADMATLFYGNKTLLPLKGYNNENNELLQKTASQVFLLITPLQIMKSFIKYYFTEGVVALLNDIVVEGLFSNVKQQKSFGNNVYSCTEIAQRINDFENSFEKGGENDFSALTRLAMNSKTNPDLAKQLMSKMSNINVFVKNQLHVDMGNFSKLTRDISDIFVDAKKGSPEIISNIKMILFSTRNKEHTSFLDSQFQNWKNFIEIMKNYVLFSDKD